MWGFPGGCNTGDLGSIPGSGSSSGEGNGYSTQDSCLENFMDWGAWRATVHDGHKEQGTTEWLTHTSIAWVDGIRKLKNPQCYPDLQPPSVLHLPDMGGRTGQCSGCCLHPALVDLPTSELLNFPWHILSYAFTSWMFLKSVAYTSLTFQSLEYKVHKREGKTASNSSKDVAVRVMVTRSLVSSYSQWSVALCPHVMARNTHTSPVVWRERASATVTACLATCSLVPTNAGCSGAVGWHGIYPHCPHPLGAIKGCQPTL